MSPSLSNSDVVGTRFRAALARMAEAGRLKTYDKPVDTHLEVAAIMKKLDGGPSILFTKPNGFDMPVLIGLVQATGESSSVELVDPTFFNQLV